MDILVFGGTVFLSRAMAETAVAHGHRVTTFNRGISGPAVEGAEHVVGDRGDSDALGQLAGRSFDLVFDTAYDPALVAASTRLLAPTAGHYAYVSSINAYPGWPEQADYRAGGAWDAQPDSEEPDDLDPSQAYGWRKVKAERTVLREFGAENTSNLRAGCIVGPNDATGRLPWWLDRVAKGGEILAPGEPQAAVRLIDCRDIAEFALLRAAGTFEVTGPADQQTRAEFLETARAVTGSDARFTWLADAYLAGKVEGWTEVPLWSPADEVPSLFAHDTRDAESAGLRCRPMAQTMADTWAWMGRLDGGWQPSVRTPGLATDKEVELLTGWRQLASEQPS